MASINDVKYMTSLGLESNFNNTTKDKVFYLHRGIKDAKSTSPILVLIHGYPQSSFMWRHILPLLPSTIPVFIPDIPGYGRSSPLSGPHDKRSQAAAILSALSTLLPHKHAQRLILIGHDRGARICHRLAVDNSLSSTLPILGVMLLDIVPTLIQWCNFSTPSASRAAFHWPFLANAALATAMIKAQGGDVWMRTCLEGWVGHDPAGLAKFRENDALEIYASFFKNEEVIKATCDDYRAGAEEDVVLQEEDQKQGRKIDIDVLVMYSAGYLGKRYDVRKVWEDWMGQDGSIECIGIEDGIGHFVAEAPERVAKAVVEFYKKYV